MTRRPPKPPRPQLTEVQRMIAARRRLIAKLRAEILAERSKCEQKVVKIEARIRISEMIVEALEKGTTVNM